MKTIILFLLFLSLFIINAKGQTIGDVLSCDTLKYYEKLFMINNNDEEIFNNSSLAEQKRFYRWDVFWDKRVDPDGSFLTYPILVMDHIKNHTVRSNNTIFPVFVDNGPIETDLTNSPQSNNIGRTMSILVDPTDPDIVLAGSAYGGIFKTENALTTNPIDVVWENITDEYFCTGVLDMVYDPFNTVNNTDNIYVVTGNRTQALISETRWGGEYGLGVWKSTDGGDSWFQIYPAEPEELIYMNSIICDPDNEGTVYALSQNAVYKSTDGGSSWSSPLISFTAPDNNLRRIVLGDGVIYIWGKGHIHKSSDGGTTWINVPLPSSITYNSWEADIEFNPSNHKLYALFYPGSSPWGSSEGALISYNGTSWDSPLPTGTGLTAGYIVTLRIDPQGIIYAGGVLIKKSTDGGYNFFDITVQIHDDTRDIAFFQNGTIGFLATDGGVVRNTNTSTNNNWISINGNLSIAQFYDVDSYDQNPEIILGGSQDDGTFLRQTDGKWRHVLGGDGGLAVIDDDDPNVMFGRPNTPISRTLNGTNWYEIATPEGSGLLYYDSPLIYNNTSNEIFTGRHQCWWSVNTPTLSWSSTHYDYGDYYDVTTIGVCPSNPDKMMICLFDKFHTYTEIEYVLLSTDKNNLSSWTDIKSNFGTVAEVYHMSDIEYHPYDCNKIWVTYSGFIDGEHVYYSSDGGTTWTNITYNLIADNDWNIPTNCVAYDVLNGGLFLGTDFGIFYLPDGSTTWEHFDYANFGFPEVMVSDISINYKTGELIIGTFGRGVWKASVSCPIFSSNPLVLNNDVTWKSVDYKINRDIVIEPGVVFTIENGSNVQFGADAGIKVKPGGKLIVDNSVLTNLDCDVVMWQGIEVQGDKSQIQSETNQGVVEIINGGTIENAVAAIRTLNTGDTHPLDFTGGIIRADGANFINNYSGIYIAPYHNHLPNGTLTGNISYIQNSTFETNSALNDPTLNPTTFICLNEVEGVIIQGNTFTNTNPAPTELLEKGNGIYVFNSSCTISSSYQPNTFQGLNYAIQVHNPNSIKTVSISNNTFSNNYKGIFLRYTNNSVVTSNTFDIPDILANNPQGSYGLYVESCSGYKIEGNEFQSVASQLGMYGVAFKTFTNQVSNTLYHNRFTGLSIGVLTANSFPPQLLSSKAVGPQQPILFIPGLQIKCNRFEDIINKNIAITSGQIGSPQGNCISVTSPANNMFSITTDEHIFVNPGAGSFGYCYSADALSLTIPDVYTSGKVTLLPCTTLPAFDEAASCPSTLNIIINQSTTKSIIAGLNTQINTLGSVVDGGNTQSLLNNVNSNINSGELRNILLAPGPYLSDTVLIAVIKKTNPVPPGILKEIIVPNSPLTTPVMNAVNTANLPAGIMQEIQVAQTGTSERAVLEQQIATLQQQKDSATAELMRYYLNDTSGIKIDSVILFLESQSDLESQKQLVTAYLMQENCTGAIAVLDSLPQQSEEDIIFKEFYSIMLDLCSQGKTVFDLTSEQEQTMYSIVATNTPTATAAKSVLTFVYGEYYPEIIEELYEEGEAGIKGNLYESFECGGGPVPNTKIYLFDENNEIVTSVSPAITDSTGFFWFNNYYLSLLDTTALYSINTTGGFKIDNPEFKTLPEWFGSSPLTLNFSNVNKEWGDYYSIVDSLYNGGNAIDLNGNIYVTGYTAFEPFNIDFLTIKYSPTGQRLWVKTYNGTGNGDDRAIDVAVDNDNNCYVLGSSIGSGTGNDIVLIKYDSKGNQLWVNRYNSATNNEDVPKALAVDISGNVYVTCYTKPDVSSSNILTIKYSRTGSVQWIKTFNIFSINIASDIKIDMSGNIIVVGTTSTATNSDYVTIKYNKNGSQLWARQYDSRYYDNAVALSVDKSNNIYVTGSGNGVIATIKYNPSGVQQWVVHAGSNSYDITTDNLGNVYLTGSFNTDGITIKYNSNGQELWNRVYTSNYFNGVDRLQAITLDKNNDVYVTGFSATCPFFTKCGEIVTIKYNTDGNEEWIEKLSGYNNYLSLGNDIVVSDNFNVYITGSIAEGIYKMATVKYSQCPSLATLRSDIFSETENSESDIQVINFNENTITVYPNPYSDNTLIEMLLKSDADVSLEVYTLTGQCIADIYYGFAVKGEYSYNFSAKKLGYSAGTYILKATVNNEVSIYWLVEMK